MTTGINEDFENLIEDFEKWIKDLKEQHEINEEKILALSFFGKLDTLKLFKSLGLKNFVDAFSFDAVICGCGNIEVLDWLEENYGSIKSMCENDSYVPAKQGKLEVLKWMHNHRYKFDQTTMTNAVTSGNFKLVKWLHEDVGCEIGQHALNEASIHGHPTIFSYLINKAPKVDLVKCQEIAVKHNQATIFELIDSLIKPQKTKPQRSKNEQIKYLLKQVLDLLEDL